MASAAAEKAPAIRTIADLLAQLGDVSADRVRFAPPPGTATEQDVIAAQSGPDRRFCELVHGVLVEKPLGTKEALYATLLAYHLMRYLDRHNLGLVLGADATVRLWRGRVRIPDVMFISWDRIPGGELPDEAIASIIPDLAVEVLSPSNTKAEMALKRQEYFTAGVRLVWIIDPATETAEVSTSPTALTPVDKAGALDGGDVLLGLKLPLRKLFSRRPPKKP
jgi:Uma2 family endonuclease